MVMLQSHLNMTNVWMWLLKNKVTFDMNISDWKFKGEEKLPDLKTILSDCAVHDTCKGCEEYPDKYKYEAEIEYRVIFLPWIPVIQWYSSDTT